jgi:hypothetical protein
MDNESGVAAVKAAGITHEEIEANARALAVKDTLTPRSWGDGHHCHAMLLHYKRVRAIWVYVSAVLLVFCFLVSPNLFTYRSLM